MEEVITIWTKIKTVHNATKAICKVMRDDTPFAPMILTYPLWFVALYLSKKVRRDDQNKQG